MSVLDIIKDKTLTYEQMVLALARKSENSDVYIKKSETTKDFFDKKAFCDLFEGNAPYRPRYILPDYEKFFENGSEFLGLEKPQNIWEATNNLLIFYKNVPSITTFPVYLGNIDYLLEPFVQDKGDAYLAIKLFLIHIDKTLTDSFVHANIGPLQTKAGKIILEVMRELELAVPNLTIKYDDEKTTDDFAIECVKTALITAKPSFANDKMYSADFDNNYGIASCYNGLMIGGGGFTLTRINLNNLSDYATDSNDFIDNIIPLAVKEMATYINMRIDFLVSCAFFKSNFLVKEGFIDINKFSGMLGVIGVAECVNKLLKLNNQDERFGYSEKANEYGVRIVEKIDVELRKYPSKHTKAFNGVSVLHAQVGIETDEGTSPGARIPVGEEPEIYDHILMSGPFHKYFTSGIGDIFVFDQTHEKNPEAILKIIKGAFESNLRYISIYSTLCDVVRVTGYLIKRSELAKLDKEQAVLNGATVLGKGARDYGKALDRKKRY
ncbi:MAG: YjjI family glycine radical enzyme [Bacilli bacterium]